MVLGVVTYSHQRGTQEPRAGLGSPSMLTPHGCWPGRTAHLLSSSGPVFGTVLVYWGRYNKTGGLNNRNLFLTILEAGKSTINVLADSVSDGGGEAAF